MMRFCFCSLNPELQFALFKVTPRSIISKTQEIATDGGSSDTGATSAQLMIAQNGDRVVPLPL
jgi:hypothetical protein